MNSPPDTFQPPSYEAWVEMNQSYEERRAAFPHDSSLFDAHIGAADAYHLFELHQVPESRNYGEEFEPMSLEELDKLVESSDFKLSVGTEEKTGEVQGNSEAIDRELEREQEVKLKEEAEEEQDEEEKDDEKKEEDSASALQATFVRSSSRQPTVKGEAPDTKPPAKAQVKNKLAPKKPAKCRARKSPLEQSHAPKSEDR